MPFAHQIILVIIGPFQQEGSVETKKDEDQFCNQPTKSGEESLGSSGKFEKDHVLLAQKLIELGLNLRS